MDARFRRSRARLHDAVRELAAGAPVADLTVTAICRAAGVTRDTFYRHAASPTDLLADALGSDLESVTSQIPRSTPIGQGERILLAHVQTNAAAYRNAMTPLLAAPVRERLERTIHDALAEHLRRHPQILPASLVDDPVAAEIAVAYAASGTVGAIERWLRDGADDVERAVEVILAASPAWWLTPVDESG